MAAAQARLDADAQAQLDADAQAQLDADAQAQLDADAQAQLDAAAPVPLDMQCDANHPGFVPVLRWRCPDGTMLSRSTVCRQTVWQLSRDANIPARIQGQLRRWLNANLEYSRRPPPQVLHNNT